MKLSRESPSRQCADVSSEALSSKLGALSHPARIEILRQLSLSGCCCCKDVVDRMDLAQSTVSQHLKVLVDAGLVRYRPEKQRSRYEIDTDAVRHLSDAVSDLLGLCCVDQSREAANS